MPTPPLHPNVIEFLDDLSLLEAYQQIVAEAGGSVPEELIAEIERRNLDI